MAQIDGAGQQDTDNQNAEALQAALAQREVTLEAQPQGGSDVPSHQNSDPVIRRIGNSTPPIRLLPKNVVYRAPILKTASKCPAEKELSDISRLWFSVFDLGDGELNGLG